MPYKANEPRRYQIPKAHYGVENWAAYDAALRRRGDLTIWRRSLRGRRPPRDGVAGQRATPTSPSRPG